MTADLMSKHDNGSRATRFHSLTAMEPSRFLINGEWLESEVKRPVVNPYDNTVVGEVFQSSPDHIEAAIRSASDAFQTTRRLSSFERSNILFKIAGAIEANKEAFANLITTETGKPIALSRVEVARSIFTLSTSAEEAKRIEGTVLPLDLGPGSANRTALIKRFPLGPISAITPFNFPLNLVAHKLGPAIASGNTMILKPSSSAPMTSLLLGKISMDAGLPKGAFNIVPCLAGEAGQLIEDKRIKLVSFTGSPAVGWPLKARAGKKRVVLELGGNAAVIVDNSADLNYALQRILQGSYGNAGQSCIAVQRIYVHDALYKTFTDRFVKLTSSVGVGDPRNERTLVGPMINEEAARKIEGWIQEAVAAGARLLCGGKRQGAILEPTILVDVSPSMNVACQEVFAPVVTLEEFSDFAEVVGRVNHSAFGLQAGLFTNDFSHITYAFEELEVGGVVLNDSSAYRMDHMPYGGVKDSGFGREGIRYAIEEMTEMKLLAMNLAP